MKRIALILVLFLSMSFCYAIKPYMRQNDRCTVVDLASAAFLSHLDNSSYDSSLDATNKRNTGKYYHMQNLAVVGVTEIRHHDDNGVRKRIEGNTYDYVSADGAITISVELVSAEWCYTLIGNEEYKRPFGIDFFARGKHLKTGGGDVDIPGASMHMGLQPNVNPDKNSITLDEETVVDYDAIWWDCALVMDLPVDTVNDQVELNGTVYHLLPSDDFYTATVRITISCTNGTEETYDLHLAGTYKPNNTVPTNMTSILTFSRLPSATNLDIKSLYNSQESVPIATYGYTTNSIKNGNAAGLVYMYLSSSSNGKVLPSSGNGNDGKFTLRYMNPNTGAVDSYLDSATNSINFIASINSDNAYKYGAVGNVPRTSGVVTIDYTGSDIWVKNDASVKSNYLVIVPEHMIDKQNDKYARWYDSGTISIRIPNSGQTFDNNPDNLIGGIYSSNIFIHVVTYL